MHGPSTYASIGEALRRIESEVRVGPSTESVDVRRAFKRILSRDAVAKADIPPRPVSRMDGFAVKAEEVAAAGRRLKVKGGVRLGEVPRVTVGRGEAVPVATGSYLPRGSDAVLPVEDVERDGGEIVAAKVPVPGEHVYAAGADVKKGTVVLPKGRVLRAQDVGMLMLLGFAKVDVFRRPKVALLSTGSELTDSPRPVKGKVRNSHGVVFERLLGELGCDVVEAGVVRDDVTVIADRLRNAFRRADLVFIIGGTSRGRHDLVEKALLALRPDALLHGIRMDRGRVTGCAVVGGKPALMMPGPIQGGMNAFLLFGLPMIGMISGGASNPWGVRVKLRSGWEARKRFEGFAKVVYLRVAREGGGFAAEPLAAETESMAVLTSADAFTVVPEGVSRLESGEEVDAFFVPGFSPAG